ncbi:MAG: sugar phosphate isomerase/epimerase [Fimbriimonadaceae bacterium]|nr:sugar phosphate isomerase/epimerase [Fimbriimonadaceae bacterium]
MKFGLIHYNAPGETLEAFLDYAAETGFDGVELQIRDLWDEADPAARPEDRAWEVRRLVVERGLFVGALSAGNDFLTTDSKVLAWQAHRLDRVAGIAALLGCGVLRCDGGWPRAGKEVPPEDRYADVFAAGFKMAVPFLQRHGVVAGLDNHGTTTNNAEFQMQVLGMVGSPSLGTVMDTMNYRWMGWDIPTCNRFYELSALRAVHVHLKDGTGSKGEYKGCALGDGEIDLAHAVRALKAAGYNGLWCAEYEGRDADGYTRCLAWMKEHVPAL